ncbi:MAG: polysaccharide deacetylase family protein [Bryobacteraceae bacterium]
MFVGILAVAIGIAVLCHTAPFPFLFDAAARKVSVWRVPEQRAQRAVYLTFDDGPNPTVTGDLLDLLQEKKVPATFFLIDHYVTESTAPLVRRMFEEGHTVAQHTGDRRLMLRSPGRMAAELKRSADHIERLTGFRPCPLFRPHAGWRSVPMLMGLSRAQYKLVGWSWFNWDWVWFRERTADRVAAQILQHAAPGGIIVIHDGHHRNPRADRRYAVGAAAMIVDRLRARGFEFSGLCATTCAEHGRNPLALEKHWARLRVRRS